MYVLVSVLYYVIDLWLKLSTVSFYFICLFANLIPDSIWVDILWMTASNIFSYRRDPDVTSRQKLGDCSVLKMSSDKAKRPPSMDTPKSEEPQPKVPRRVLVEGDAPHRIKEVQVRIQEKKEVLRKLNLAKTYRTKWETHDLGTVTDHWLQVCQTALEDLRARLKEGMAGDTDQPELTFKILLNSLGIDPELVQLDEEEDCFIT